MEAAPNVQDIFIRAAWSSFFILGFALNTFVYGMKAVLWTRGYPTSFFSIGRDAHHFKSLIATESDAGARRRYVLLQSGFRVCFALFFVVPLFLVALSLQSRISIR